MYLIRINNILGEVQALIMGKWRNYTSTMILLCPNFGESLLTFHFKNVLLLFKSTPQTCKAPSKPLWSTSAMQGFNQAAPDLVLEMKE